MNVSEGLGSRLRCMHPGCGGVCSEDKVKALLKGEAPLVEKYEQSLLGGWRPASGSAVRMGGGQRLVSGSRQLVPCLLLINCC